ncbi:MAG: ATP/GTP-binding protein [Candidatus Odinarchaeia archaeon]
MSARPFTVFFVGPAGSGKTTLTYALGRWIEKNGFSVGYVNLDPGCEYLPYKPNFDVREIVRVADVMVDEKLGPNAAIVRSMEIMESKVEDICSKLLNLKKDFLLLDTPGQMELFLFHKAGLRLLNILADKSGRVTGVFIMDAESASRPIELIIIHLMSVVVELQLGVPTIPVLNKCDLNIRRDIVKLVSDWHYLREALKADPQGVLTDLALGLADKISEIKQDTRIIEVSAKSETGLEALFNQINEVYCACGDLT